jgi:LacI family transcriptional regulator
MNDRKRKFIPIGFVSDLEHKSARDHYSGLLRFLAARDAPWEIQTINPCAASDVQLLRFLNWSPVGLIAEPEYGRMLKIRLGAHRLKRTVTVYMNREKIPSRKSALDIRLDNQSIAEAAASLLMRRGIVNFAYVDELERAEEIERSKARGDAFVQCLMRHGFACSRYAQTFINGGNWSDELNQLAEWLTGLPKPCALMAYADTCAKRIYDACNIARLRIPDQIRVIGVDNDRSLCENLFPSLSSVEPDFERCGYLAGQLLFERLQGSASVNSRILTYGVKSVIERASTQDVKGSGRIVTAACEIIRLHASEGIGVADVATRLNVSRRLLELRFHEVLGKGVAEELRRVRLEHVCRQLRNTRLSIREISAESGFASSAHLNALFLATYGMTMRDWRKFANSPELQSEQNVKSANTNSKGAEP